MQNMYWLHDSGSGKRPSTSQTNAGAADVVVGLSVVVVVFEQMNPTEQRASVGLKFEPEGQRKVYSWNVEAVICRQYLYV